MCCTMVWVQWFAAGIAVGLAGIALTAAALPLYNRITRRERQKLAPEILRLTADLEAPPDGRPHRERPATARSIRRKRPGG